MSNSPFNTSLTAAQQAAQSGVWSSHQTAQAGSPTTITVAAIGRYVMVQLNGTNYLTLAEVQVTGTAYHPDLALGKTATESSTYTGTGAPAGGSVAALAVDGNTDGVWADQSLSSTNSEANTWWQVDLGAGYTLSTVSVFNRTDCCGSKLSGYYVFVSNSPFNMSLTPAQQATQSGVWSSYQTNQAGTPTTFTPNVTGRYVMVQLNGTNYLTLAEVQVTGA